MSFDDIILVLFEKGKRGNDQKTNQQKEISNQKGVRQLSGQVAEITPLLSPKYSESHDATVILPSGCRKRRMLYIATKATCNRVRDDTSE